MDITGNTSDKKQRKDGENIKYLLDVFGINQVQLSEKAGIPQSTLSVLLSKDIIDDESLTKISEALGNGLTVECLKQYNHDETKRFVVYNLYQTVNEGGRAYNSGSISQDLTENAKVYNSGSQDESTTTINNPLDKVIKLAEELREAEVMKMYYRMKVEPEKVEEEMQKKQVNP
jgi:Helix-turn-helix.